ILIKDNRPYNIFREKIKQKGRMLLLPFLLFYKVQYGSVKSFLTVYKRGLYRKIIQFILWQPAFKPHIILFGCYNQPVAGLCQYFLNFLVGKVVVVRISELYITLCRKVFKERAGLCNTRHKNFSLFFYFICCYFPGSGKNM